MIACPRIVDTGLFWYCVFFDTVSSTPTFLSPIKQRKQKFNNALRARSTLKNYYSRPKLELFWFFLLIFWHFHSFYLLRLRHFHLLRLTIIGLQTSKLLFSWSNDTSVNGKLLENDILLPVLSKISYQNIHLMEAHFLVFNRNRPYTQI